VVSSLTTEIETDNIASIFKRMSEPVNQKSARALDLTTYKVSRHVCVREANGNQKYVVQRKIAIGRHERILAIDGDYIHVSCIPEQN
jgi:hypothetical protein